MKPTDIDSVLAGLVEKLAQLEHERWSHWQRYLHSRGTLQRDGSLLLSARDVQNWDREINTSYAELSDQQKESDREQVRKYLPLIAQALKSAAEP